MSFLTMGECITQRRHVHSQQRCNAREILGGGRWRRSKPRIRQFLSQALSGERVAELSARHGCRPMYLARRAVPYGADRSKPRPPRVPQWSIIWIAVAAVAGCLWSRPAQASEARFLGNASCAKSTCHGSAVPRTAVSAQKPGPNPCHDAPQPWKWAWTQWHNEAVDHHSRAYATLRKPASATIGRYMNIKPESSEKCLRCHAPAATAAPGWNYLPSEGVTCEHCHGGAELWKDEHSKKDWRQRQAEFAAKGFYDNRDLRKRAEKCAQCHVEIDHEIIAGGHPPLQFEMVFYAQLMKHWNDSEHQPQGSECVDPKLWAMGQLVGLRHAADQVAHRATGDDYQSLGKFPHFKDRTCYECHHKLVDDALRQAEGHYAMADVVLAVVAPAERGALASAWSKVLAAARSDAEQTQRAAAELGSLASTYEGQLIDRRFGSDSARNMLKLITSSGESLRRTRSFAHQRDKDPKDPPVELLTEASLPWWYTTGAPEQAVMAIMALCGPAFDASGDSGKCGPPPKGISADWENLVRVTNRFDFNPEKFKFWLAAINGKLF